MKERKRDRGNEEGGRKRNNGVEKEIIMLGRKGGRNKDVREELGKLIKDKNK